MEIDLTTEELEDELECVEEEEAYSSEPPTLKNPTCLMFEVGQKVWVRKYISPDNPDTSMVMGTIQGNRFGSSYVWEVMLDAPSYQQRVIRYNTEIVPCQ